MKRKKAQSPYVQGYDACYRVMRDARLDPDVPLGMEAHCPFISGSTEREDWLDGWRAAEKGLKK